MHPSKHRFSLGFTALALRPELARIMAAAFLGTENSKAAKAQILGGNALQTRTGASAIRIESELRRRISSLTPPQLELLATSSLDICTSLSWLSLLKTTPFIMAFAADILRHKLQTLDHTLRRSDYENFFSSQSSLQSSLAELTPSTKAKVRSVLLNMLRESGILVACGGEDSIQRPLIPPEVTRVILADNPRWLAGFLVPDPEIANLASSRQNSPSHA